LIFSVPPGKLVIGTSDTSMLSNDKKKINNKSNSVRIIQACTMEHKNKFFTWYQPAPLIEAHNLRNCTCINHILSAQYFYAWLTYQVWIRELTAEKFHGFWWRGAYHFQTGVMSVTGMHYGLLLLSLFPSYYIAWTWQN
jgi:hypothetical protein